MRLMLLVFLAVSLFTQSSAGQAVDPAFHYPKSPQIQVIAEGSRVRALKGSVKGTHGVQIAGKVLVELIRGPGNEERLDARFCDDNGAFDFGRRKKGRYYVKVSMDGWDTLYFPVLLGSRGQQVLSVELRLSN